MVIPDFLLQARSVTLPLAVLLGCAILGAFVHRIGFLLLYRAFDHRRTQRIAQGIAVSSRPAAFALPLIGILTALPFVYQESPNIIKIEHVLGVCIVAAVTWAALNIMALCSTFLVADIGSVDELHRREIATRILILSRITSITIGLLVTGAALISFPSVRAVGTTLVASAGIAGIAAGLAARPILENLIAGIQLAFTQPIRIDDEVIVETEYGRIERITATYVVVRTWDRRRLIVPLTYFLTNPFQNWSLQASNMIGNVLLWVDFGVPLDDLRAQTQALASGSKLWDGDIVGVQVVDSNEKAMQVRILVTARNPSDTFDLRCVVREGLLEFLQQRSPNSLPQHRLALHTVGEVPQPLRQNVTPAASDGAAVGLSAPPQG